MKARGFTLIEVLVALAIVAIALGAGLRAAGALTDNAQRLADVTGAQWCAENQFAELRLTNTLPGVGESDFSCEQLGRAYRGKLISRPAALNTDFRQLQAVISDENGQILLILHTLAYRR